MKVPRFGSALSALFALNLSFACAKHGNVHLAARELHHKHHRDSPTSRTEDGQGLELRGLRLEERHGKCEFPTDVGLVPVTPNDRNGGWAMSPDQCCEPGGYCPYACPPGQVMAQWDPDATSYTYPQSMNGGLYCDQNGVIRKPFPDKPYCVDGTGNVGCKNKAKGNVAFCQTVLPGNEAMLIPTSIEDWAQLAVPGPSYWAGTAAHFYINPPGISTEEACVWGSASSPIGNWSPYVAGANTDHNGDTFIKLAWNPIYLEPATPFRDKMPTWGVKIECEGHCNGLPCAIDPAIHKVNEVEGQNSADGAGGANFCVVTVPEGSNANFVVFEGGSDDDDDESGDTQPPPQKPSIVPAPSSSSPPPSSSSPSSSTAPPASVTPVPTSTPISTSVPTSTPSPTPPSVTPSSSPSPLPSTSPSIGTSAVVYTPPAISSASANTTTAVSQLVYTSSVNKPSQKQQNQQSTALPVPSFSYKPHVAAGNNTAAPAGKNHTSTFLSNKPLYSTYPGPAAGSGAGINKQVTFAGFGLTILAAIAVVTL